MYVSVCDIESSTTRGLGPSWVVASQEKRGNKHVIMEKGFLKKLSLYNFIVK
jgi:hypothetical protein